MNIINQTINCLQKYELLNKESHFLVGFSGGADSMLLLYYLKQLQNTYKFRLSAIHINHNWRGEESDLEEKNCKDFCNKNSINFYVERLNDEIKKDENSARIARYEIFDAYAKKINATAIMTAHNSTDVVETFLYRLAKGTGAFGALSVPEVRDAKYCKIYRPFLTISSSEIREQCKKLGLNFNNDSSNKNNKYKRNHIRNNILPKFEKINSKYEEAILGFIENLKSNENIIKDIFEDKINKIIEKNVINTDEFIKLDNDLKRVVIHKFLKKNNIEPEKKLILKMINCVEKNVNKPNGKKYSIKSAENSSVILSWFCSEKECYLVKKNSEKIYMVNFEKSLLPYFEIKKYSDEKIPDSTSFEAVISKTSINFPLVLRNRKKGDIIQPFSHKTAVKLKDYFIEKNVPEHKRDAIHLLCKDNEVLWAIGVGLSEKLRANLSCSDECIIIRYNEIKGKL